MTKELLMSAQRIQNEIKSTLLNLDSLSDATEVNVCIYNHAGKSIIYLTQEQQKHIVEYLSCECKKQLSALEDEFSKL